MTGRVAHVDQELLLGVFGCIWVYLVFSTEVFMETVFMETRCLSCATAMPVAQTDEAAH
jgi:hypothetical protein